jgi:hypothetical protein
MARDKADARKPPASAIVSLVPKCNVTQVREKAPKAFWLSFASLITVVTFPCD